MTPETVAIAMKTLKDAGTRNAPADPKSTARLWLATFRNITPGELFDAVHGITVDPSWEGWWPTPGQVLARIPRFADAHRSRARDAWALVNRYYSAGYQPRQLRHDEEGIKFFGELWEPTKATVQSFGGWSYIGEISEHDWQFMRREFFETFDRFDSDNQRQRVADVLGFTELPRLT